MKINILSPIISILMFNSSNSYDTTDSSEQSDKSESEISEETDSDTSSVSELDQTEAYQIAKQDLITRLIEPIKGTNLEFFSDDYFEFVKMNDSFEICLLRIIHLLFGCDGIINFDNLKLYMDMDKDECSDLLNFFIENPGIMPDAEFYQSMTGLNLRYKWASFLSHRKFFSYEKVNWQIKSCLTNFYEFIRNFLPEVGLDSNENKHHQTLLNQIYSRLSFNFEKLDVIWELIRSDSDNLDKSIQYIYINGFDIYSWSIIELKVLNENTNDITIKYYSELIFT